MHFTHVDHLATIVRDGLLADVRVRATGALTVEVGNQDIKQRRRARVVPVAPRGVVANYVPFYLARLVGLTLDDQDGAAEPASRNGRLADPL